jgi:hypothetical protein
MKRNISLLVLTCEIAVIVVLHALKMSQVTHNAVELNGSISKSTTIVPLVKPYQLVSLK